eukprot:15790288-Heterocapsa_arctica.AAC.1
MQPNREKERCHEAAMKLPKRKSCIDLGTATTTGEGFTAYYPEGEGYSGEISVRTSQWDPEERS